jgi:hypothetical protein
MYLQHMVCVTPLLLSAAIVEELETGLTVLWVAYATHSTLKLVGSNFSTIAADSSNDVTNTICCRYICMRSG